ncbi:MAG: translocation/assembly module TamB, partial [Pseudomonadota bacterium]
LIVSRLPEGGDGDAPSAGTTQIAVPELPVSVTIDALVVEQLTLGAPILGESVVAGFDGRVQIAGGAADVALNLVRVDGPEGRVTLEGSFDNDSRALTLDAVFSEGAGGIVATRAGLPGAPSVVLAVDGSGPLDDFTAELSLETEETPRLTGAVRILAEVDPADETQTITAFGASLNGDLRPLVDEAYHEFLGDAVDLEVAGLRSADGALSLERLDLDTGAMVLRGAIGVSAAGWPTLIDLKGTILPDDGAEVLLAVPGQPTSVQGATLAIIYDQAQGDTWRADIVARGVARDDADIDAVRLRGGGVIEPGDTSNFGGLRGAIEMELEGLALSDPALAEAMGDRLTGSFDVTWSEDQPVEIMALSLAGADYGVSGDVTLAGVSGALDLAATTDVTLRADRLDRFSALAGRVVQGAALLEVDGTFNLVSGGVDLLAVGRTQDLAIGQPQVDALLATVYFILLQGQEVLFAER